MIIETSVHGITWLIRRTGVRTVTVFFLLSIILSAVAIGIAELNRGLGAGLLLALGILGLLAGWSLARTRIPSWLAALVLSLLGLGILLFRLGNLWAPLLDLLNRSGESIWQVILAPPGNPPDLAPLRQSSQAASAPVIALLARLLEWIAALLARRPAFDPVAATLAWGLAIWCSAAWASWSVRRYNLPLPAVIPGAALLAASLSFTRTSSLSLLPVLAGTLLLLAIHHFNIQENRWERENLDYYVGLRRDLFFPAALLTSLLTLAAVISPSLTISNLRELARQAWGLRNEPAENLAKSLGLKPGGGAASPISSLANPGLPREHLIGSGPELSRQLVMEIALPDLLPESNEGKQVRLPNYYWRGLTYEIYTGHGWRSRGISLYSYKAGERAEANPSLAQQEVVQQVSLLANDVPGPPLEGVLYAAGTPVAVDKAYRLASRSQNDVFGALVAARSYQAVSLVTAAGEDQLRASGAQYPDWVRLRYLSLPDTIPERVLILARDLTAAYPTPYDRARAIEKYLRTYPYTLDLPAPPYNRDIVDYFLFDLKKGYCDYYATAMVVLARAAGLPARLVSGYATGMYDTTRNRFLVTAADAHSWVEVYFPGIGWVEFEPTAGRPAIERAAETQLNPPERPSDQMGATKAGNPFTEQARRYWKPTLLTLLGALMIGLAAWSNGELRRLKALSPTDAITRLYRLLRYQAGRLEIPIGSGDTPYEFRRKLDSYAKASSRRKLDKLLLGQFVPAVHSLVELFVRAAYSPRPPGASSQNQVIRMWSGLRWRLWAARLVRQITKSLNAKSE